MFYFFWKLTTTTIGVGEPYYKRISLKAIIFDARVISQSSSHNNLPKSCHENICRLTYSYVNIILLNIPTPRAELIFFNTAAKMLILTFVQYFMQQSQNQYSRYMKSKKLEKYCIK